MSIRDDQAHGTLRGDPGTPRTPMRPTPAAARPAPRPTRNPAPAGGRTHSRPDPTAARLALGMAGAAATTAIVAAIVGASSPGGAVAAVAVADPQATPAPQAAAPVRVRHVTKVVTIPSDATPPPRKVVYATPVPAPPQQVQQRVVVVKTTQSGRIVP